MLWSAATYIWVLPPVHRLAVRDGFVHLLDHLSFLVFGLLVWLAATSSYYLSAEPPPGGLTQKQDQVRAASLMLGFEIVLSALAVVLAFIWVSVSEGRARKKHGLR